MEIIFDLFNRHGFEMCITAKNFAEQGPSKFFVSLKNAVSDYPPDFANFRTFLRSYRSSTPPRD